MAEITDPKLSQTARALGRKLQELAARPGYKLSTRKVAAALEVSAGIVSLWYRGKRMPRMENLAALAKLFDVELGELFEYVPGMAVTDAQFRVMLIMRKMSLEQQERLAAGLQAAAETARGPQIIKGEEL